MTKEKDRIGRVLYATEVLNSMLPDDMTGDEFIAMLCVIAGKKYGKGSYTAAEVLTLAGKTLHNMRNKKNP